MRIRKLGQEEHGLTRKLYETVFFQDEVPFVDYYYACKTRNNVIYVAEDESGIHSMLHLNPVLVSWNGKAETIYYIVAVATEKEYRHRGLMRQLVRRSLQELYNQNAPFAFLMPASEAIYTPFGFRRAWNWQWEDEVILGAEPAGQSEKVLKAASSEKVEDFSVFVRPAEACSDAQLQQLNDRVNNALNQQFTLFTCRSREYYRNLDREQKASGGNLEILFRTEDGEEYPVSARCSAKESFPSMMTRILHLESFIRRLCSREERTFYWDVKDQLLPGNNGLFRIRLTCAGGEICRLPEKDDGLERIQTAEKVDISEIPERLEMDNPFLNTFISEVV